LRKGFFASIPLALGGKPCYAAPNPLKGEEEKMMLVSKRKFEIDFVVIMGQVWFYKIL